MNILNRNNQLLPKTNQFVNQPMNNQINHINNQQKFNNMNNQTGINNQNSMNNQAGNMNNQAGMNNQTGMNNQNNQAVNNNQNNQLVNNNQNNQDVNNNQSETKKGINLVLCILAALSIHEAAKYFINKSIRLNNGTSSRYLYYAVACILL